MRGMHGFGSLSAGALVNCFDLSFARSLVDLGGGTGIFAVEGNVTSSGCG